MKPQPNDVLFGRGSGPIQFAGNKQFRRLAAERKEEYIATSKHKEKRRIAKELLDHIHSLGGRFLQLKEYREKEGGGGNIVEDGIWMVAESKVAIEKCKQTLREKSDKPSSRSENNRPATEATQPLQGNDESEAESVESKEDCEQGEGKSKAESTEAREDDKKAPDCVEFLPLYGIQAYDSPTLASGDPLEDEVSSSSSWLDDFDREENNILPLPDFPPTLPSTMAGHAVADARLHLFQQSPAVQPAQTCHLSNTLAFKGDVAPWLDEQKARIHQPEVAHSSTDDAMNAGTMSGSDDDASDYLLSILSLSGRATITEEQEQAERATMTDEERAEVLADMFGDMCTVGIRPEKRAKRDFDTEALDFLVKQMRLELERIPIEKKQALMEAQLKAHPEEFGDERIVTFLRCEGMNAKVRLP